MNFPIYIAKRYLISKKSKNAINIISLISVIGVAVGTAALVIVLSVFNGFEDLLKRLNNSFDPDIKIEALYSKTFVPDEQIIAKLNDLDFIEVFSFTLEENAMLEFDDRQIIAGIKGVDEKFEHVTGLDTMIISGEYKNYFHEAPVAIAGRGIAFNLRLNTNFSRPVSIYVPSRTGRFRGSFQDASDNINRLLVYTGGIFAIQQEYDSRYVIIPLKETQELLEYENDISAIEIKLMESASVRNAVRILENIFGEEFSVKDRNRQHEYAYKIMQAEKWTIFLILIFILLIASFNVIGSLTMLIIEKKNDIKILKSMGADNQLIRKIFFFEGIFICLSGALTGIFLGGIVSWLQMQYGFVSLGTAGSFIIDSYPVHVKAVDIVYIFAAVMIIGVIAAWYPVRYITRKFLSLDY